MRNTALLRFLCFSWSIICLSEGMKIKEMLRRRRQTCENGTYKHGDIECCRCPIGFYLKEHCTVTGTTATCARCERGYYRDRPNSLKNCEPCTACLEQANRRVETECASGSDTVCACLDDHYCDQGDKCRICHRCDKCQDSTVKAACTATNNTVCSEKKEGSNAATIVLTILAVAAVAAIIAVFIIRKKRMFCFSTQPTNLPTDEIQRDDVDLTPVLSDIARRLGWRVVRDVARPLVTQVEIDNIKLDYPMDAEEQTIQLLRTWHQKHGLVKAYSTLVRNLKRRGHIAGANEVDRIVQEHLRNVEQ